MRQLWYIAVADMISALSSIAMFVLDRVNYQTTLAICTASQYAAWGLFLLSTGTSILVQAHFTAGLLMSLRHWKRGLAFLRRILPALLLPAMLMTGLDLRVTASVQRIDAAHGCRWVTRDEEEVALHGKHNNGPFTAGVALTVILVNGAVYALLLLEESLCASCCMPSVVLPGSIGARVLRQARRYMMVTLCTWLPYWVIVVLPSEVAPGGSATLSWASTPWQAVSAMGITLNGAMNVWSFALHNRHIKRALAESEDEHAASFSNGKGSPSLDHTLRSGNVAFDATLQICELSDRGASLATSQSGGRSRRRSAGGLLSAAGEDPLGFVFCIPTAPDRPALGQ